MKTASRFLVFVILSLTVFPLDSHGAVRKCNKELEDGYKKFKKKMVFRGFSQEVNRNKSLNFEKWLIKEHADTEKHEEAHAKVAGKWGKKIIYRYYKYWGKKYAITGCVPLRSGLPAKIAADAALAPDKPSSVDLKIAKKAKLALEYEKDYKKQKAASKKCDKIFNRSKKAKCKKTYRQRLSKHPFQSVKANYSW